MSEELGGFPSPTSGLAPSRPSRPRRTPRVGALDDLSQVSHSVPFCTAARPIAPPLENSFAEAKASDLDRVVRDPGRRVAVLWVDISLRDGRLLAEIPQSVEDAYRTTRELR